MHGAWQISIAAFAIWASVASTATADPIQFLADVRLVTARALAQDLAGSTYTDDQTAHENPMFATATSTRALSSAFATAGLSAGFGDLHRQFGVGGASSESSSVNDSSYGEAMTRYGINFLLESAHAFSFSAEFDVFSTSGDSSWRMYIVNAAGSLLYDLNGTSSQLVSQSGFLPADTYGFYVIGTARANSTPAVPGRATASFDFTLDLTDQAAPVPEPASMLLFAAGLAGIGRLAHRRRARLGRERGLRG